MFDQEYDDKGEELTLYDEMKQEMNQQSEVPLKKTYKFTKNTHKHFCLFVCV